MAACIVLVVVLEGVAADEGMDTQRLEGSRFGAHLVTLATFVITLIQPKRAKSSGSRERLLASQLYRLRYDLETEKPALDPTIRWVLKHFLGVGQAFRERGRRRGRERFTQRLSFQLLAPSSLPPSTITHQVPVLGQIRKTGEKGQCDCDRENQCTDPGSDVLGGGRQVNPGSLVNTL